MIELLVVILIIGILATIAIPSFLSQRPKASDASAKELARTAQTIAETIAAADNGSYATVSGGVPPLTGVQYIQSIEPTINTLTTTGNAYLNSVTAGSSTAATSYTITATSPSTGDTFSITRNADGTTLRTCTVASASSLGGCTNGNLSPPQNTW